MGVSIRDVAREAGVSPATVSRVLNGSGRVSDSSKRRVLAAVRKLGYRTDARSLEIVKEYKPTVAMLVPSLGNPFCGELAEGVQQMAMSLGYHVLIVNTGYDTSYELEVIRDLYDQGVEGFLVTSNTALNERTLEDLVREGYPLVLLTKEGIGIEAHSVLNDDFRGAALATNHLIEYGHRHIAAVMLPGELGPPERTRGYRTAMEMAGLGKNICVIEMENETIEDGYRATLKLLRQHEDVTGIVAHNDLIAVGVLQACRELHKRVPDDISIVGYDGTILASVTDPPLTTIVQPTREIGRSGMKLLHEVMTSDIQSVHKIVLQPALRLGSSTKPLSTAFVGIEG